MSLEDKLSTIQDETVRLLEYANETTGEADSTLGDAVKRLADGYGGGGLVVSRGEYNLTTASRPVIATLDHAPKTPLLIRAKLRDVPEAYSNGLMHTIMALFTGTSVMLHGDRSSGTQWVSSISGYPTNPYYSGRRYIDGNSIGITAYPNSNSYTGIWDWEVVEGVPFEL